MRVARSIDLGYICDECVRTAAGAPDMLDRIDQLVLGPRNNGNVRTLMRQRYCKRAPKATATTRYNGYAVIQ
jgi:hypothetical protein